MKHLSRKNLLVWPAVVMVLSLILSACGGGGPAPDASLCNALPAAQLQQITGTEFKDPKVSSATTGGVEVSAAAVCTYSATQGGGTVTMTVFKDKSADDAKTAYDNFKQNFGVSQQVAGIGDDAYLDKNNNIHFLKGNTRVYVEVNLPNTDPATQENYGNQLGQYLAGQY